jgi:hypothetical protein
MVAMVIGGGIVVMEAEEAAAQAGGGEGMDPGALLGNLPEQVAQVEGCLGVDTAQTSSGKNVIFAWFEDKAAVERWYYNDTHQGAMQMFFPQRAGKGKPLAGVPDDSGPLMVIASITMKADGKGDFEETELPISQIAIEVYAPVTGGFYLGERFAPEGVRVKGMRDVTLLR